MAGRRLRAHAGGVWLIHPASAATSKCWVTGVLSLGISGSTTMSKPSPLDLWMVSTCTAATPGLWETSRRRIHSAASGAVAPPRASRVASAVMMSPARRRPKSDQSAQWGSTASSIMAANPSHVAAPNNPSQICSRCSPNLARSDALKGDISTTWRANASAGFASQLSK